MRIYMLLLAILGLSVLSCKEKSDMEKNRTIPRRQQPHGYFHGFWVVLHHHRTRQWWAPQPSIECYGKIQRLPDQWEGI